MAQLRNADERMRRRARDLGGTDPWAVLQDQLRHGVAPPWVEVTGWPGIHHAPQLQTGRRLFFVPPGMLLLVGDGTASPYVRADDPAAVVKIDTPLGRFLDLTWRGDLHGGVTREELVHFPMSERLSGYAQPGSMIARMGSQVRRSALSDAELHQLLDELTRVPHDRLRPFEWRNRNELRGEAAHDLWQRQRALESEHALKFLRTVPREYWPAWVDADELLSGARQASFSDAYGAISAAGRAGVNLYDRFDVAHQAWRKADQRLIRDAYGKPVTPPRRRRNPPGRDQAMRRLERYGDPRTEEYWRAVGAELRRQGVPGLDEARPVFVPGEDDAAWRRNFAAAWRRGTHHNDVGGDRWARLMAEAVRTGVLGPVWNEAVHDYVSPRERKLSSHEDWVRHVAYLLKRRTDDVDAMTARAMAAGAMQHYVPAGAVLVPAPASTVTGHDSTLANRELAVEIAAVINEGSPGGQGVTVLPAVWRTQKIEGSHQRRRDGRPGATLDEHLASMRLTMMPGELANTIAGRPVVIVDNVVQSGATIEAVRQLIGRPDAQGLAWAQPLLPG